MPVTYSFHGSDICPADGRIGYCDDDARQLPSLTEHAKGPPAIDVSAGIGTFLISAYHVARHAVSVRAAMARNANIDKVNLIMVENEGSTLSYRDIDHLLTRVLEGYVPLYKYCGPLVIIGMFLFLCLFIMVYIIYSLVTTACLLKAYGCRFWPLLGLCGKIGWIPLIPFEAIGRNATLLLTVATRRIWRPKWRMP